jgi:cold shock protein
MTFVQAK